jgi:hypothetical protein
MSVRFQVSGVMSKSSFLFQSAIATIVAAGAGSTFWMTSNDAEYFLSIFQTHFLIVLTFWVLAGRFGVKNWLLAGLVGSIIYTFMYVFYKYSIDTDYAYDSIWKGMVIVIEAVFAGLLGALPLWIILRRMFPTATRWVIANAAGYGIISFYGWFRLFAFKQWALGYPGKDNMLLYQILQHMGGHRLTMDTVFFVEYGLFGILLGSALVGLFTKDNS